MKAIVISLVLVLLSFLTGFLSPVLCWIAYAIVWIVSIVFAIIDIVNYKKKKDNRILIGAIISIMVFLFGSKAMVLAHNYNEIRKDFNEKVSNYKIVGISKNKYDFCDENKYVFNIQLNGKPEVQFHASYCNVGISMPDYEVCNDWYTMATPYYLEKFNKEKNTNIQAEYIKKYEYNNYYILYDESKKNDIYDFVDYLISNSNGIYFQMMFYNKNLDRETYFNSWNDNNRSFLYD